MRRRRFAAFIAAVAVAAGGWLALPAWAAAQATVTRYSIPFQEGPTAVDDTCAGRGVVGILTSTGTLSGQAFEQASGSHFGDWAVLTRQDRLDFPDGSYLLASARERITFNANLRGGVTFGGTLLSRGTLYDAAGNVIGHEMVHHRFRITVVNGTPRVEFDQGFIRCR